MATSNCPQDFSNYKFYISELPALPNTITVINPTCSNPWNGGMMLVGGTASSTMYSIAHENHIYLDPSTIVIESDTLANKTFEFTKQRSGTHIFELSNSFYPECNVTLSTTLYAPPEVSLTATITVDDLLNDYIKCYGDLGTVTVNTSVESYVWSLVSITKPYQEGYADLYTANHYTVSYLPSDTYYFTARRKLAGNFECYDTATITLFVPQPTLVVPIPTTQSITCWGTFTGQISWTVAGGTPPYRYSWQGLNPLETYIERQDWTEPYADKLYEGTYTFTVKDTNNCTHTRSLFMPQPKAVNVQASDIAPIPCRDTNNTTVSITIFNTQGTFGFDIWRSYNASRTLYSSENTITQTLWKYNLYAGDYELVLYDSNRCPGSIGFQAIEPDSYLVQTVRPFDVCEGQDYGSMEVLAQGSNGAPYYYAIDTPENWLKANVNSSTQWARFEGLPIKDYELYILDNGNCLTKTTFSVKKRTDPAPSFKVVTASLSYLADRVLFRDVCVPEPDSVRWEYSKALSFIENNTSTGESRGVWLGAEQEGTYGVKMYGFWGYCNYNVTKSFTFNTAYNPYLEYANVLPTVQKVTLYPNPSSGVFKVFMDSDMDMPIFLELFDLTLQSLWSKETAIKDKHFDEEIDLNELDAGQYLLIVKTPFDVYSSFLVIAK